MPLSYQKELKELETRIFLLKKEKNRGGVSFLPPYKSKAHYRRLLKARADLKRFIAESCKKELKELETRIFLLKKEKNRVLSQPSRARIAYYRRLLKARADLQRQLRFRLA